MNLAMSETMDQLLYLIACVLQNVVPKPERLTGMNLDELYRLAKAHSLRAITCAALDSGHLLDDAPEEHRKKWHEAKNKAIRKNMLLDAERAALFQQLNALGIWHMALKGSVLKDLYPGYGMREMADNDILYDAAGENPERVKELMLSMGYKIHSFGTNIEDNYEKPPIYNMEMHRALIRPDHKPEGAAAYYADIMEHMISNGTDTYEYHFSNEEFYIYFVVHAYKHFSIKGTGLRTLVDFYVMEQAWGETLDWEFVWSALKTIGGRDYAWQSRALAVKLFSDPGAAVSLNEREQEHLAVYAGSGTYGTTENRVRNRMKELQEDGEDAGSKTRLKYVFRRVFISREKCKVWFPFFYRHPVLLPALWVFRMVRVLIAHPKKLLSEWRAMRNV